MAADDTTNLPFSGKTLLMLGSNVGAVEMVDYANALGARTIVADWYPVERSAAKQHATDAVLVSTADLDELSALVTREHVNGVLAGISEFNLLQAMELSSCHGLPFYCTRQQWNTVESKDQFRELCLRFGVPCPKTFFTGSDPSEIPWQEIVYPVVLKPVDASSSSGVHMCASQANVKACLGDAFEKSPSGNIIIEQQCMGVEFTAHYTVSNGKAALACIDNRYPAAVHEGAVTTVPVARVYPSLFTQRYIERVNESMLSLVEGIGLSNAVLFVQGLYDQKDDSFVVFEAGLRSAGEAPCRFIERVNGLNYFGLLVDHALSGAGSYSQNKEDPFLKGKCCGVVSFVTKGGVVGAIEGLKEAVAATPSVVAHESRYPVGSQTPDGDTLRQLMIRFVLVCDSREQMMRDVGYLNNNINVRNEQGDEMVIKFDPSRLTGVL